jgi:hypothetical protein
MLPLHRFARAQILDEDGVTIVMIKTRLALPSTSVSGGIRDQYKPASGPDSY